MILFFNLGQLVLCLLFAEWVIGRDADCLEPPHVPDDSLLHLGGVLQLRDAVHYLPLQGGKAAPVIFGGVLYRSQQRIVVWLKHLEMVLGWWTLNELAVLED